MLIQRKRRLMDIRPERVDLVDRAANKKRFLVIKEELMGMEKELVPMGDVLVTPEGLKEMQSAAARLTEVIAKLEGDSATPPVVDPAPSSLLSPPSAVPSVELQQAADDSAPSCDGTSEVMTGSASLSSTIFREVGEKALSYAAASDDGTLNFEMINAAVMELKQLLDHLQSAYPNPTAYMSGDVAVAAKAAEVEATEAVIAAEAETAKVKAAEAEAARTAEAIAKSVQLAQQVKAMQDAQAAVIAEAVAAAVGPLNAELEAARIELAKRVVPPPTAAGAEVPVAKRGIPVELQRPRNYNDPKWREAIAKYM